MRKRLIAGVTVAAAAILLAGCTGSSPTPTASGPTSATYNLYQAPQSFDPLKGSAGGEVLTEDLIYDNLVQVNPDFTFEPRLASSWDMSSDGKTWTFHLVQGQKWSDGTPFTSDDVLWSLNTYASPTVGSAYQTKFAGVVGYADVKSGAAPTLSGITAPDDHTIVIQMAAPSPGFLASIAQGPIMFIMPKHTLSSIAPASLMSDPFWSKPTVGMGPYTMTNFVPNSEIDLVKNPNFREPVGIDNVYLKMLTSDVAEAQLQTGELDLAQVAPADLPAVSSISNVSVSSADPAGFLRIVANDEKFPAAVRAALLTGIDRDTLVKTIYGGKATVQNSSFMTKWAMPTSGMNTYPYDQAKAKSMLQAAGFDFSKQYVFEWVAGTADRDQAIQVILQEWQALGVNVVAKQVDAATQTADIKAKSYDFTFSGGGTYTLDPASSLAFLLCANAYPAGGNVGYYCNPSFDSQAQAAQAVVSQTDSTPLWNKAILTENADVAEIWLYAPQTVWATNTKLQNFVPYGDLTNVFADAYKWTISQ